MNATITTEAAATLTPLDVAWHNIKQADKHLNLKVFTSAAMGWLKANNGTKNYQDLEKELRERNLETHLIAAKPPAILPIGCALMLPHDASGPVAPRKWLYEAWFSCRPRAYALQELLTHNQSYEDNFAKLAFAATIGVDEPNNIKENETTVVFKEQERNQLNDVAHNRAIVTNIQHAQQHQSIREVMDQLKVKYPDVQLCPITDDPNLDENVVLFVFASQAHGGIVTDIAFLINKHTKKQQMMRIVDKGKNVVQ